MGDGFETVALADPAERLVSPDSDNVIDSLAVDAGSVVELSLNGRSLSVTPARRSLADRLAASPKSPKLWQRDDEWLEDAPQGREAL